MSRTAENRRTQSLGRKAASKSAVSSTPEQDVFLGVLTTAELLVSELQQLLKPEELSDALYNVLRILRGAGPEGLPCSEIAARMVKRDPDITRLVDRLVTRGLVGRERQAADRRVVKVTITKDGLAMLERLDRPVAELHKRQLGHVGKTRLRELAALLEIARER